MNRTVEYLRGPFILIVLIVISRYLFPSKMTFLVEITTFSIYIIANDILYGYMGMVSFGQPFYLGVGAYTAAIYLAHIGNNPLVAIMLALLAGLLAGVILGPAYIRLRGDYFALINAASCGLGLFLVEKTFLAFTRGDDGLWYRSRMQATPFLDLRKPNEFFWFAMIVLFLVLVWYTWLNRSTLGAAFRAIKVNESGCSCRSHVRGQLRICEPQHHSPGPCCGSSGRYPARRAGKHLRSLLRHCGIHRTS
ncbi:MAG: ABC-type branched-chain amino acid transport system, permease component [Deltaproteobacteria bacterium]|nr:ABC-type branched-chain amino acid transport system, permease component [Deltaproteobacteria bacterium]